MVLGSPETIIRMVQKGLGISILSLSEELRAELPLACLPFGEPQLTRRIGLLERQERGKKALVEALAQAVAEAMRQ